jgi:hypothetical protein
VVDQLANEEPACYIGVASLRQVDRHELDTTRVETWIARCGPVEGACEQASGNDENNAERHLPDDKRVPQAQPAYTRRFGSQTREDVGLRSFDGGRQP